MPVSQCAVSNYSFLVQIHRWARVIYHSCGWRFRIHPLEYRVLWDPKLQNTLFTCLSSVNTCPLWSLPVVLGSLSCFLRVIKDEIPLPALPKGICLDVPAPGTGDCKCLRANCRGPGCGARHHQLSVLSFPQLLWGPSGPRNHFSMTKTIQPDLWSFGCPDLYIPIKVICPFKL